jgi:tyrosine-protein kinase Etk/Wzc
MKEQEVFAEDSARNDEFDFKRWLSRIMRSWYWFAGSIFICLTAAWLYMHYSTAVFQAVASVMIKDEKKGGRAGDNAILEELGIGSNKLVENEIEILKSYDLMQDVVKKLQLFIAYSAKGKLKDVQLFDDDLPFQLEVQNVDSIFRPVNWEISANAGKFTLVNQGKNSTLLQYGQVYTVDDIRFVFMPNEAWRSRQRNDTLKNWIYSANVMPVGVATGGYSSRLSVDAVSKQASVVNLTISDANKKRAVSILAALIDIYNMQGLNDKNLVTANTIEFLNERLRAVSQDLQGVEGQVQRFKSANQLTDISKDAQQYMDLARGIDLQKAESQTKLNIVSALEKELIVNQDNPGLVPSTLGIEESSLASLVEKHNTLVLEKERVEKNKEVGPQNPRLIDLRQQVQETRSKLLSNVRTLKQAYIIALNDISRKDDQLRSRIRNIPQLEQKLVEIQRNQNVEEQLYAFLLQKREEAAVTLASNIPDSRTIVKARGLGQVSPKGKSVWAMAIVLGVFVPLGVMIVGDFFNNKVGDVQEVEQKTKVPLLGVVSHIRKIKSSVVISQNSRSVVAEQIRTLRTAIGFTGKGTQVKKILVTSAQPGDGKSFISINLAASYALLGLKTLLVELDLRKPHVAKYLNMSPQQGITSILAGKASVEEVLIKVPEYKEHLSLLPAGYLPPNPAELISGAKMEELMKQLESQFDCIIIDTPPFGLVTDAVLLQKYADITLVVLRQGHTQKDVYVALNQRASQKPDYPLYAVLNGVGWRKRYQQGYGYGKYGSYGYGSGYFDDDKG